MSFKVPTRTASGIAMMAMLTSSFLLAASVSPTEAADFGPVQPDKFDAKKAEIGKRLFYDKRLSGDAAISCASCHDPKTGFANNLPLSKAYPGSDGFRNAPTLTT